MTAQVERVMEFVLPPCSDDFLSEYLRALTKAVCDATGDDGVGGLGGEYGYGANFENDVFMLHRFCWCEGDDCPWCADNAPNFRHKASGATVHWYKYIGRGMEVSEANWHEIMADCLKSITTTPTTEAGKE